MATMRQIDGYANMLIATGAVPARTTNGRRLATVLVQGWTNEHYGELPSSPEAFVAWASTPYWQNAGLRRHWPPGSQDVKTDGHSNPPPWDWNPMGCPPGGGCNEEDWGLRFPAYDPSYGVNGEALSSTPAAPGQVVTQPGQIVIPGATGLTKQLTDFWNASTTHKLIVGGAGLVVLKLATARR